MKEERYMYDLINDLAEMTNLLAQPEKQKRSRQGFFYGWNSHGSR